MDRRVAGMKPKPDPPPPPPTSFTLAAAEWVLMDAAVHAYSMVSGPLYDTLGPDAVEYICNHTELACVGCSAAVLPVLMGCLERCKTVRVLVGGVGGEYDLVLRCCRCSWPAWGEAEAALWNAVSQYYSTLLYPHPLALSPAGGVGPGHGAPPGSPARQQCAHHQLGPGKWYSCACVGMCVRGRGGGGGSVRIISLDQESARAGVCGDVWEATEGRGHGGAGTTKG